MCQAVKKVPPQKNRPGNASQTRKDAMIFEHAQPALCNAIPLLREVDVKAAFQTVQAALPAYDIRALNCHRPKRDYFTPDQRISCDS